LAPTKDRLALERVRRPKRVRSPMQSGRRSMRRLAEQ
jgi:hypothetical protein